jgi:hypothetical protein
MSSTIEPLTGFGVERFSWLFMGAVVAAGSPAWAEPTASEKDTARALMSEGRDLRDSADLASALKRFQAADAIMHVPTTALEVARTQAAMNLLVEARETLHKMLQIPSSPGDPSPFRDARVEAERLDEELESRVGSLRVEVRSAPNAPRMLVVDGVSIPDSAVDFPIRVNPGHHLVVVRIASAEVTKQVDAPERQVVTVVLDFDPAAIRRADVSTGVETSGGGARTATWRTVGFVGIGLGALGVGVGGVTGLMALSAKSAVSNGCVGTKCPPQTWSDVDKMNRYAGISTAAFAVGAVGLAVGVGGLVIAGKEGPGGGPTARANVRFIPSTRGMVVTGEF